MTKKRGFFGKEEKGPPGPLRFCQETVIKSEPSGEIIPSYVREGRSSLFFGLINRVRGGAFRSSVCRESRNTWQKRKKKKPGGKDNNQHLRREATSRRDWGGGLVSPTRKCEE